MKQSCKLFSITNGASEEVGIAQRDEKHADREDPELYQGRRRGVGREKRSIDIARNHSSQDQHDAEEGASGEGRGRQARHDDEVDSRKTTALEDVDSQDQRQSPGGFR